MLGRSRLIASIAVVSLFVAAWGGCGGGAEPSKRLLRASTNFLRFSADQSVPGTSIARAAELLDEAVQEHQAVRSYLDRLANSSDPYGVLLTSALCTGMNQLAQLPEDERSASQAEWRDFLVEQVNIIAPYNPLWQVQQKVDVFVTTARLAEIDPRFAQRYVQVCVTRRS